MRDTILRGARAHNLKGIDLTLRPGEIVALTGVSGAGKSSLALDTLYAEGQRRFVESFSPYARQFLERLERPPLDLLEPVPAAIAVDRSAPVKSSRSTLATMADIEPYLAALFVRESQPICPEHRAPAQELEPHTAAQSLCREHAGERVVVSYRAPVRDSEHYLQLRDGWLSEGYRRLWLNGAAEDLDSIPPSAVEASAQVVLDRLRLGPSQQERVASALEKAFQLGHGVAHLHYEDGTQQALREGLSCQICARPLSRPSMGTFSYESALGACSQCRGFGRVMGVDWDKVIPDRRKTLAKGAIRPWSGKSTSWERSHLRRLCARQGIPMDVPVCNLGDAHLQTLIHGDHESDGLQGWFSWLETKTYKMHVRVLLSRYRSYDPCPSCGGGRLSKASLHYLVHGLSIAEWHQLEVSQALAHIEDLQCASPQGQLAQSELLTRLSYLKRVGLGYLTLDRQARTLSGGEAQRVTLTAALGTQLHHALFVLDEPSVGLHPHDVAGLSHLIRELADRNNTVVLIEHDPTLIRAADRVVEMGPGAGDDGGRICFDGDVEAAARGEGPTARALALRDHDPAPTQAPEPGGPSLRIVGATAHNLRDLTLTLPLERMVALAGPSGSGKSSIAEGIVYRSLARRLGALDVEMPEAHSEIVGADAVRKVILVDQSPLGRTSRGNAATYTKAWDGIRQLFAAAPRATQQKLTASHFSFNVGLGRCEACKGEGFETVEMQFLADVRLSCPSCGGRRFNDSVLQVEVEGRNIGDVLEMTIEQAVECFSTHSAITRRLRPLLALGLGYVRLGQPLSTLSGGEAQRLKLARSLSEKKKGSLWVLDEPSAGLHTDEVERLLRVCRHLVDGGASVLIVEHDLQMIAHMDWVVELGPGAGSEGGQIVFEGPPAELAQRDTKTGSALRNALPAPRKRKQQPSQTALTISGAREHNLRNVDVQLPHEALSVVTGPSGSGKSSLAFDVLFAEGQRRFLETLTPYARQFLPSMPRPDVDRVGGVPPAVSLEQRTARAGAKSTVATVTEVSHYVRLLFAKLGTIHCPEHDTPIITQDAAGLLEKLRAVRGKRELCAPAVIARKGTHLEVFERAAREGIALAYADGKPADPESPPKLARTRDHTILLQITALGSLRKLSRSDLDRALRLGNGQVTLRDASGDQELHSLRGSCEHCGFSHGELDPRLFSFNTVQGRCPDCEGHGSIQTTLLPQRPRRGKKKKKKGTTNAEAEPTITRTACRSCEGTRLARLPRAVRLADLRFDQAHQMSIGAAEQHFSKLKLTGRQAAIGTGLLEQLSRRLGFLTDVGLGYLSLDRAAHTLSGGEMQRLRLAAQLGAGLTGALYVLDEPTIGLHPRDTGKLLGNLRRLVELGSTVVVVEHDEDTIRAADHLLDLGPGGGSRGGEVVASGRPEQVLQQACPTGVALSRAPRLREPEATSQCNWLELTGASQNNLQKVDLKLPLGRMSVVAGVSGSGKSTLVRSVLLPALRQQLGLVSDEPGAHRSLHGFEGIRRAISVDQSPIGRTPRSVPATFLGIWDAIRRIYAATTDAQVAGFTPARFSFNTAAGGRCGQCAGVGAITHEMSFLPDVVQPCPSCRGLRFEPATLGVRYRGLSIGDVLQLPAERACEEFANHPKIVQPLQTLCDLGAGYITLGQGSHTLSGGEAQRLKLASELTEGARHEPTLYVLDEPTTGLHLGDVERLMSVLGRLVARGDTLVVIEHHPWVIASADWVVELGPEGGAAGGRIVACGRPGKVQKQRTPTGQVLAELHARWS